MGSGPSAVRRSLAISLGVLGLITAPPAVEAAKDHCRKIELTGQAGSGNKPVLFYVKSEDGLTLLGQSCPIIAGDAEFDYEYITRLPYAWAGDPDGPPGCPDPDPLLSGYDENDPLNNTCVNLGSVSCKIKSKVSPKPTATGPGTKKKYAELCCYQELDCSGDKAGQGAPPTPIPITIQVEKEGSGEFCPDPNNCEDCDTCVIDPDPLGSVQRPSPAGARCRDALGNAVGAYILGALNVMVDCHRGRMAGKIPPATDCNSISQADTKVLLPSLADDISAAALGCMGLGRSPSALGYRTCPAPCNGISMGGCTAGNGSPTCTTDRDCDTVPGAADGRCGDWAQAAACLNCVAESAVTNAIADKYGTPSVSLSEETQQCQHAIGGYGLLHLMRTRIGEALDCQKKLDAGKATLASGVSACKDSDPKAKIAAAQAKAADAVQSQCDTVNLVELNGICSGAPTLAAIGQCVIDNAKALTEAFAFAVVPSSARRCGDNLRTGFEQCDGTDDANCPGQCDVACACPPPLVSPVFEDLSPCVPTVADRYEFQVTAGQNVQVSADTVDPGSAADLCFGLDSGCTTGDTIIGDEDVPCSFESPLGHDCPLDTFVASGNGICAVEVTECFGDCANPLQANYKLTVTRNGNPAQVLLTGDDQP